MISNEVEYVDLNTVSAEEVLISARMTFQRWTSCISKQNALGFEEIYVMTSSVAGRTGFGKIVN